MLFYLTIYEVRYKMKNCIEGSVLKKIIINLAVLAWMIGVIPSPLLANNLDFTVTRLGSYEEGAEKVAPHILVVAGIQGDEPGGFSAASLLVTHYTITKGYVTIVPNLNFLSIINRNRGTHGDMNRKFADLNKNDPEYDVVRRIQNIIVSPEIDLILNLHDGSGYYNPKYISKLQNPRRWGNSIIIDQERFDAQNFGELASIAHSIAGEVNKSLLKNLHKFNVHNTKTGEGNKEMAKTLTWFALGNGKPAFGLEASKELSVAERVYYHLSMLEAFLDYAGIEYERSFELSPPHIKEALSRDIYIGFVENRMVLPLNDVRREQAGSIPLAKKGMKYFGNSPILVAVPRNNYVQVHYGNNRLTTFRADWHELDKSISYMNVIVDGVEQMAFFGDIILAEDYIFIESADGYRVNAIGAMLGEGPRGDESGKKIYRKNFLSRFSVNKQGTSYRVEVYRGKKYVGTLIVQYQKTPNVTVASPLPMVKRKESNLGR